MATEAPTRRRAVAVRAYLPKSRAVRHPSGDPARPPGDRRRFRRLPVLGLRARITATFALGALVVSGIMVVAIYFTSRGLIIDQQLSLLRSQAFANAGAVNTSLSSPPTDVYSLLRSLNQPNSDSVLYTGRLWYGTWWLGGSPNPQLAEGRLPTKLVDLVQANEPAEQTYMLDGAPRFAVGIPIEAIPAEYYEVFDLSSVQSTLHRLLGALLAAAALSTFAGAAYGRFSAGRALRPLRVVGDAARAIAGGQLGTRLESADVNELAVLASSFNRMVDQLQERIERDARFTSDVSHELRSPLTTLAASFSVLESRAAEMPERAQLAVTLASAELRRFQRMVGDLLEISRLDSGSVDLSLEMVRVGELLRRTVGTAVRDLRAHGLYGAPASGQAAPAGGSAGVTDLGFPLEIPPQVENRQVMVDKRRFERIVANLLENAALYGGGPTRVAVEVATDRPAVRLVVDDAGPGIPPEERDRIFERFSRGASARRRGAGEGTGLGLALVAEHVRLHGGRVWVEEPPGGQGARFVVELPLASAAGQMAAGFASAS
jgi:two-component system sensor histidine kinase MtrB